MKLTKKKPKVKKTTDNTKGKESKKTPEANVTKENQA